MLARYIVTDNRYGFDVIGDAVLPVIIKGICTKWQMKSFHCIPCACIAWGKHMFNTDHLHLWHQLHYRGKGVTRPKKSIRTNLNIVKQYTAEPYQYQRWLKFYPFYHKVCFENYTHRCSVLSIQVPLWQSHFLLEHGKEHGGYCLGQIILFSFGIYLYWTPRVKFFY